MPLTHKSDRKDCTGRQEGRGPRWAGCLWGLFALLRGSVEQKVPDRWQRQWECYNAGQGQIYSRWSRGGRGPQASRREKRKGGGGENGEEAEERQEAPAEGLRCEERMERRGQRLVAGPGSQESSGAKAPRLRPLSPLGTTQ